MSVSTFMIVGSEAPIYELDMSGRRDELAKMSHFIIHAALDSVDMAVWVSSGLERSFLGSAPHIGRAADPVDRRQISVVPMFCCHQSFYGTPCFFCAVTIMQTSAANFLRVVDRHNELLVSAYVTAGGTRFMLLHDGRNEDGIRGFCTEVHELYTKLLLNPFYAPHSRIDSRDFDTRVRAAARRYLGYRE